ncbi:hypothetical protein ILUMI_06843 [Ignelater luminosus]|uniref:Uncharacterized protein n=1 Tax=Ignelater luminosus TaxID=2038154 RepID=A0A8K0D7M1_IGNLU|nr:hypothetical protein ILUMI_06843 [Ignelater luminosus]
MYTYLNVCLIIVFKISIVLASEYFVILHSDSPIVRGGTVHFVAKLYDGDGDPAEGSFKYEWEDNSIRMHTATHETKSATDTWNVTYPANEYFPPGPYEVQVSVYKYFLLVYYPITSQRIGFNLTENLNGKMDLMQDKKVMSGKFISNAESVTHKIILHDADAEYINKTATSVLTYWFVDCIYYGVTNDYAFSLKYPDVNKKHRVEALVVAGFDPITTPAPSTTVAPTTTTTTHKPTTVAPITTKTTKTTFTVKPNVTTALTMTIKPKIEKLLVNNSISNEERRIKRAINHIGSTNNNGIMVRINGTLVPYNGSFPFVCLNNNTVAPDVNKTYGYFSRKFTVKAPVSNISVTGNYWLHKGDLLNLMVKCHGTPQFYYCKHVFEGIYNVTGNETCDVPQPDSSDKCEFVIERFLRKPQKYTIAIVIYNDVGKIVSPVTVTVYEVTKQAQLSVIVVPVVFSLVAVVLIVFGVAYYMQNRSRFTVEVADFNFGQQCSDMEYKTFRERLRDSITNAFMRAPTPGSSEPTVWPPGRKYGSLT